MASTNPKTKTPIVTSYSKRVDNGTLRQDIEELNQKASSSLESPAERGSDWVSGSTPDPSSDDDVLQNAHQMGIAPDADLRNPKELNIAKDVRAAERSRRTRWCLKTRWELFSWTSSTIGLWKQK